MPKNTNDGEYQFEIRVNVVEFMKGDVDSIGVIFANMDGRNFAEPRVGNYQTHEQWLAYMASEFQTPLELRSRIEMLSPEGVTLEKSSIGASVESHESLGKGLIRVRIENEDGREIVEFTPAEVLEHNGETRTWEEIGNDPTHQHAQMSLAEDFALFRFRRSQGDQGEYRVDVLDGLTANEVEDADCVRPRG